MKTPVTIAAVVTALSATALGAYAAGGGTPTVTSAPAANVEAIHAWAQTAEYAGSKDGCRKCHLREYRSWERTPHAKALEVLSDEEQKDPACLKCHTTGYGTPTGFNLEAANPQLANIGCEQCHGPGSVYMDKETMKDRDASIAAGLLLPNEATCLGCHNSESPTFSGEFDFEARKEDGVHDIKR